MIVSKFWINQDCKKKHLNKNVLVRGWFLFGFIPLYIKEIETTFYC